MKIILRFLFLTSLSFTFSANAEEIIELKDSTPILGKWLMYAETAALHKSKKEVANVWKFSKDGGLYVESRDPRLDSVQEIRVTYSIEDGVIIKQFQPGRSKTETCKVIKLEGKEMILHCKFNYYLFKKI